MAKSIDKEVLDVLSRCKFDGNNLLLGAVTLERSLYVKTAKVIEALGGKWNRKAQAHVFPEDAEETCADAIVSGCYVDAKREFDFFETPATLAAELVSQAGVTLRDRVLEPSAGGGRIADAILAAGGNAMCFEIQKSLAEKLYGRGVDVLAVQDFLLVKPEEIFGGLFDAVVQNPPFSKSQDIRHVRHAFDFLKPGGRLVSVMGTGFTFRQDRKAVEFREWFDSVGGTYELLPEGAFKSSGTMVRSLVVDIEKE